jgi:hypothetical protein
MRMSVNHRRVTVPMRVRFAGGIECAVSMLVVRVVIMLVLVLHVLVDVIMEMRLM